MIKSACQKAKKSRRWQCGTGSLNISAGSRGTSRPSCIGRLTLDARFHLVTVAEWASPGHFMAALKIPELHKILETATDHSPNYPELYEVIRS